MHGLPVQIARAKLFRYLSEMPSQQLRTEKRTSFGVSQQSNRAAEMLTTINSRIMRTSIYLQALCIALTLALAGTAAGLAEEDATGTSPFVSKVDAWAMLFQMMGRLHSAIGKGELALIDPEEPVASVAVSSLLAEMRLVPGPKNGRLNVQWTSFVRNISALHQASDQNDVGRAAVLMKKAEEEFEELQATADSDILKAAHQRAERYCCPMHRDVVGATDERCPKCGMQLDQPVVILPPHLANQGFEGQHAVMASVTTRATLEPGRLANAALHLRRLTGHPVGLEELIETHTRKIHLLIVDSSLTDYHHQHPEPTGVRGDYVFQFTPQTPGPYYVWADLRPLPFGLQEYDRTIISGTGRVLPITDRRTKLSADAEGFHFQLAFGKSIIRAGESVDASVTITRDGKGFDQLEPVMAAFAHLVGFNEDRETVLHIHPLGATALKVTDRGGPVLRFRFYATREGFTRFFAQVQINGRQIFAPFGLQIAK